MRMKIHTCEYARNSMIIENDTKKLVFYEVKSVFFIGISCGQGNLYVTLHLSIETGAALRVTHPIDCVRGAKHVVIRKSKG